MSSAKYYVALGHGCGYAGLREITGLEEQGVISNNSLSAIQLVDQLLDENPIAFIKPGAATDLPICERDQLLAAIYIDSFGANIQSDIVCPDCDNNFEMEFSLKDIQQQIVQNTEQALSEYQERLTVNEDFTYTLDSNVKFRLPIGNDEIQLIKSSISDKKYQLIIECIVSSSSDIEPQSIEEIIDKIATLIDLELKAVCPECNAESFYLFRIQDYLLEQLLLQRANLHRQVHSIASHYGWPLDQILRLTRSERIAYYELIQRELE